MKTGVLGFLLCLGVVVGRAGVDVVRRGWSHLTIWPVKAVAARRALSGGRSSSRSSNFFLISVGVAHIMSSTSQGVDETRSFSKRIRALCLFHLSGESLALSRKMTEALS